MVISSAAPADVHVALTPSHLCWPALSAVPDLTLTVDQAAVLAPVQAFWWRSFLAHHKAAGNEDKLEAVLPVVSDVAKILARHIELAVGPLAGAWLGLDWVLAAF